jgi:LuxR family maltose regulon positive regulatory protein
LLCDSDLFEKTYEEFKLHNTKEQAKKLLSLYKGEYLADFEALWAVAKRLRYHEIYEEAKFNLMSLPSHYRNSVLRLFIIKNP